MTERAIVSIAASPWFKLVAFLAQLVIAIGLSFGAFAWSGLQRDISDIKISVRDGQSVMNLYTSEKLSIQQRIDALEQYRSEALQRGRGFAERITALEVRQQRVVQDIDSRKKR